MILIQHYSLNTKYSEQFTIQLYTVKNCVIDSRLKQMYFN